MEIEIAESINRREFVSYLTPTRLAKKLSVSHAIVTKSLEESNTPFVTAENKRSTVPERRIHADNVLGLIAHITEAHPGRFPDLEQAITVSDRTTLIVNPEERPQNKSRLRRGRQYAQRRVTFIR